MCLPRVACRFLLILSDVHVFLVNTVSGSPDTDVSDDTVPIERFLTDLCCCGGDGMNFSTPRSPPRHEQSWTSRAGKTRLSCVCSSSKQPLNTTLTPLSSCFEPLRATRYTPRNPSHNLRVGHASIAYPWGSTSRGKCVREACSCAEEEQRYRTGHATRLCVCVVGPVGRIYPQDNEYTQRGWRV